ncbi:FMN reductase [Halobacteriales archaeon SW_10_68_16]|jgi:NAD(P)H-dependent FMN reductase|nr:MAG: FMN reductase [Halobacteriales archaeon SW_10_68_16]
MAPAPTVVGVPGSLREESYTRVALDHALGAASDRGAETELLDLRHFELPVFDADHRDADDADDLQARVRRADSVLLGTPMYHGSYSAPLKNALDYCGFDEFENTTVGLLAVAGGSFPITALEHLRSVCRALNAWVLPYQAAVPTSRSQFEDGTFVDEDVGNRVAVLGERAVEYANIQPDPACFESGENVGADD